MRRYVAFLVGSCVLINLYLTYSIQSSHPITMSGRSVSQYMFERQKHVLDRQRENRENRVNRKSSRHARHVSTDIMVNR